MLEAIILLGGELLRFETVMKIIINGEPIAMDDDAAGMPLTGAPIQSIM